MDQTRLTPELRSLIDRVLQSRGGDPARLVDILLDIQSQAPDRCVSRPAAVYVADRLGLPVTQVYDVITFYSSLYDAPRAKYPIQLCASAPCRVNGSASLLELLEAKLGIKLGETTPDGLWSLEKTPCFGACDVAPAVRVNGVVYGRLTDAEKVEAMLKSVEGGDPA